MSVTPHTVSDLLSHTPVAVGSHASYRQVAKLMAESKVSALPVLAGEGRVVGVVSEADLLPKEAFREGGPPAAAQLDEAFKAAAVPFGRSKEWWTCEWILGSRIPRSVV